MRGCIERFSEIQYESNMNLYLWRYIVAWTECNNRHNYYHNNLHNSEFMVIFDRLTGMKTMSVNLDYLTVLLEQNISKNPLSLSINGKYKFWRLCSINFSQKTLYKTDFMHSCVNIDLLKIDCSLKPALERVGFKIHCRAVPPSLDCRAWYFGSSDL